MCCKNHNALILLEKLKFSKNDLKQNSETTSHARYKGLENIARDFR